MLSKIGVGISTSYSWTKALKFTISLKILIPILSPYQDDDLLSYIEQHNHFYSPVDIIEIYIIRSFFSYAL
jgi:hypothetical protein